jgi:hypothetical protein
MTQLNKDDLVKDIRDLENKYRHCGADLDGYETLSTLHVLLEVTNFQQQMTEEAFVYLRKLDKYSTELALKLVYDSL